jgi:acylphosphatase
LLKTISIKVSGKVQGVWYRKYTVEKATELGITGYVKNESDNSVYILATGNEENLQRLIIWCKQGPPKAIVEKIEISDLPFQQFHSFEIKRQLI